MKDILIVSDNLDITSALDTEISALGWSCQTNQVTSMIGAGSTLVSKKNCVIWVIDKSFIYHFGNILGEMEAVIRNCSEKTSIYFLLEDVNEYAISSWQNYAKKLFITYPPHHNAKDILSEIVLMEM